MRLSSLRLVAAAIILCTTQAAVAQNASSPPPPAGASDPASEASTHFNHAVELFHDGDFRAALIEFNRAYAIDPNFRVQYNIGQACLELQDYACAFRGFEQYLLQGGGEVSASRRALVEEELKRLGRLVAHVKVVVNQPDADILVDDVPVGRSPLSEKLLVGTGRHRITAAKSPYAPSSRMVDFAGGDDIELNLDIQEHAPVQAVTAPRHDALVVTHPSRAPFWVGMVVTGAFAASAVTLGVLSLGAQSDLDKESNRLGATRSDIEKKQDRVRLLALGSDVSTGAAALSAVITTILFFSTSPSSSTKVGVSPSGISLTGRF